MKRHQQFIVAALCAMLWSALGAAEDMDIKALRDEVAVLRAQMADMSAKYGGGGSLPAAPDGPDESIVSLRKNAVVTVGGTVNTRYYFRRGTLRSRLEAIPPGYVDTGIMSKREDRKIGDMTIADAKMEIKIDVSDHFDAYLKLDLHDAVARENVSGIAENYWVRWKNICHTGFGVLVGRDVLKFGDDQPIGILDSWNKDAGGTIGDLFAFSDYLNADDAKSGGLFAYDTMVPAHSAYNWNRTTQINPYWESRDGRLRIDLSLLQGIDRLNGGGGVGVRRRNEPMRYRSINYGIGSATARVQCLYAAVRRQFRDRLASRTAPLQGPGARNPHPASRQYHLCAPWVRFLTTTYRIRLG